MGLGREVADAYISVHGDLTDFRNDLNKAAPMTEKMARENAQKFSEAWGDRIEADVNGKWQSIISTMYSDKALDWDRLIGKFDANGNLDEAQTKILSFMEDMQKSGRLSEEEWIKADDALKGMLGNVRELRKAQQDLDDQKREAIRLQQAMTDGEKAAAAIRTRIHEDAIRENERWARSFDGITKNAAIRNLNDDFRKLTEAMAAGDMHDFAKRFDEDWAALRTRVMAVTDAMVDQKRMTEENRRAVHDAIDEHIRMEDDLRKATARTTSEVAYAKIAQDRYNKSLEGMVESSRVKRLETDFRNLSDAIDSGNWDRIAKGHKDIDSMRLSLAGTVNEMRRLGRISDGAFSSVMNTISGINVDFGKATKSSKEMGFSLGKNNALLAVMGKGVENVVGKVKGLAGFNVVGDVFKEGGEFIQNLDRNAVKIAKIATAAGGLVSVLGSSIGGIATIANDIAKAAGGLAILAPGFLTGAGIGIGVLIAAFKDMKTVLADLGPQFGKLQDVISEKFWAQAEKPIRNLVKNLFPTLEKQLANTGTAMGGLVGAFADAFKDTATPERVTVMFERMNGAIDILKKAMAPLTRAFVNLGETGSKYFGRFADWIVKVSEQFDAFIQKAKDNGDLDKWIERGIQGLKDLGSVISSTTRIFGSISDAARAAGSQGLAGFAENMRNIATFMESPRFQKALTGVFDGFYITLNGIEKGVRAVGRGFESMIPTFQRVSGSLGQVFETLGIYIEKFLSNKVLQDGVEKFFAGINTALNNLSPAIEPMANSLGGLFGLMADVLPNITLIISKLATTWGPTFDKMLEAIKPLIKPVTDLALVFIEKMGPVFDTFVTEVLPPLVDLFIELLPLIELLVQLITPVLIELLKQMGEFFKTCADGMREFNRVAGPTLTEIGKIADAVKTVKLPSDLDLGGLGSGNFAAKLAVAFAKMQPGIAVVVGKFVNDLTKGIQDSIKTAVDFGGMIGDLFNPNKMPGTLMTIATDVAIWAAGVGEEFKKGWDNFVSGVKIVFGVLYEQVKTEFQNFMRSLLGLPAAKPDNPASVTVGPGGGGVGKGPTGKLDPSMLGLGSPFGMFDELLVNVGIELNKFFTAVGVTLGALFPGPKAIWDGLWAGLSGSTETSMAASNTSVSTNTAGITGSIATFVATNAPTWAGFFTQSQTDANTNMASNALTVATKTAEMGASIASFTTANAPVWSSFFVGLATTVSTKFTEMKTNTTLGLAGIATSIVTGTQTSSRNMASGFVGVAAELTKGWNGMRDTSNSKSTEVSGIAGDLPGKMVSAMGWLYGKFSPLGQDAMSGLAGGIEGAMSWVTGAAARVASAAVAAAKLVLEINSPSKAFRRLGLGGGEGMAQGFDWSEQRVARAAAAMATVAADTVTEAFAKSRMYTAGVNAALGLADGLSSSKAVVAAAFSDVLPDTSSAALKVSGASGGVGGPTPGKVINIENLSMPITTPTKDPALVASKTIDGFAAATNI